MRRWMGFVASGLAGFSLFSAGCGRNLATISSIARLEVSREELRFGSDRDRAEVS